VQNAHRVAARGHLECRVLVVAALASVLFGLFQAPPAPPAAPALDHVIILSVDGLRSDALPAAGAQDLPNFHQLLGGAATLNARCDPQHSVTLPNHTGMLTGRLTSGVAGHGWTGNLDPPPEATLHQHGGYLAGAFDVAHDHGLRTALIASKTKFVLYARSWNAVHGAPDKVGADGGRGKLDSYLYAATATRVTDAALADLRAGGRSLVMLHYADPDLAGHAAGWDLTAGSLYLQSVAHVDRQIGRLLTAVREDPLLRGRVAVIVTADHGGGAPHRSHERSDMWVDYVIPFLVWRGDGVPGGELYALNPESRSDPGLRQAAAGRAALPPIRNADAGNLALGLLGLPAIPGSTVNAKQDLRVDRPDALPR